MAAPTFVSAGTVSNGAGSAGTRSPGLPSGVQADDILLYTAFYFVGLETPGTPTGYAHVTSSPNNSATMGVNVYWKRAGGSESAPTVSNARMARIYAVRGCIDSGNPWDITGKSTQGGGSNVSITGVTTTVDDCFIFMVTCQNIHNGAYGSWTNATLGTVTERGDTNDGSALSTAVATGVKATAGATGTTTANSGSTATQSHFVVALKSGSAATQASGGTATGTAVSNAPRGKVGAAAQGVGV
jgi:hypothetical protein